MFAVCALAFLGVPHRLCSPVFRRRGVHDLCCSTSLGNAFGSSWCARQRSCHSGSWHFCWWTLEIQSSRCRFATRIYSNIVFMQLLHDPHKIAGLLSLLAAALMLPFWYLLLFVAQPSNIPIFESASATLNSVLFRANPARVYAIWHAVAPLFSLVLGILYLRGFAHSKTTAKTLFTTSLALGISAVFFSNLSVAFWVALPCYWGYRCISNPSRCSP